MTISGSDPVHDLNQALFGVRRSPGEDKRTGEAISPAIASAGDTVALSSAVKERDALIKEIQSLPDVRVDQLASIREALEAGNLHVDGERLAAGVIRETVLNAVA